jgi:hypothetical protein
MDKIIDDLVELDGLNMSKVIAVQEMRFVLK